MRVLRVLVFCWLSLLGSITVFAQGVELASLSWQEAEKILSEDSIVMIPLGAEAKEHGPHLRLDNDFQMAEYFKRRVIAERDVIVAPTVNYHFYPAFLEYPGSTHLSYATSISIITDIVRSIARHGPKRFYILNTGVSTLRPLAAAEEELRREGIIMTYFNILETRDAASKALVEQAGGTHADEVETSIMLYIDEDTPLDLVDMSKLVDEYNPRVGRGGLTRQKGVEGIYSKSGVYGTPSLASLEKGKIFVEARVKAMIKDIDALKEMAPLK